MKVFIKTQPRLVPFHLLIQIARVVVGMPSFTMHCINSDMCPQQEATWEQDDELLV